MALCTCKIVVVRHSVCVMDTIPAPTFVNNLISFSEYIFQKNIKNLHLKIFMNISFYSLNGELEVPIYIHEYPNMINFLN